MQPTPPTLTQPTSIPSDVQIGVESTLALSEKAPNLFTNQIGEEIPLDDDTDYDEPSELLSITDMISSYGDDFSSYQESMPQYGADAMKLSEFIRGPDTEKPFVRKVILK